MNTAEVNELVDHCPRLYHMSARGSWTSILDQGLLSSTALLDLYNVDGSRRRALESQRRKVSAPLQRSDLATVVLRDQLPMDDSGLVRCLPPEMSPADWYRLLNGKVFFWLTKARLLRLLNAGSYREESHEVLEICTRRLLNNYYDRIWLCPINSGCTKPIPHPRDSRTFLKIPEYPYSHWRAKRSRGERVVELAVEYAVPDIRQFVLRVVEMQGNKEIRTIYETRGLTAERHEGLA